MDNSIDYAGISGEDALEKIEIDLLLEGIYRTQGFDFRDYMRSSLRRRIRNRMNLDQLPTITAMLNKALHDPKYMELLLEDLSINVTEMFRDPSFFKTFREAIIPLLKPLTEIRIWHAGCATGEEAYSMAILMQEEGLLKRTKIYATDMSKRAIELAKEGKVPLKRMQSYTKNYILSGGGKEFSSYYSTDHAYAQFHPSLGSHITFAQHNLATDGSFNEFHVILCRNVLIYFNQDLQQRVHDIIDDSMAPDGFLILGSQESFNSVRKAHFDAIHPVERIFRKRTD